MAETSDPRGGVFGTRKVRKLERELETSALAFTVAEKIGPPPDGHASSLHAVVKAARAARVAGRDSDVEQIMASADAHPIFLGEDEQKWRDFVATVRAELGEFDSTVHGAPGGPRTGTASPVIFAVVVVVLLATVVGVALFARGDDGSEGVTASRGSSDTDARSQPGQDAGETADPASTADAAETGLRLFNEWPVVLNDGSSSVVELWVGDVLSAGESANWDAKVRSCLRSPERDAYVPLRWRIRNTTAGFDNPTTHYLIYFERLEWFSELGGHNMPVSLWQDSSGCFRPTKNTEDPHVEVNVTISQGGSWSEDAAVVLANFKNPSHPDGGFESPDNEITVQFVWSDNAGSFSRSTPLPFPLRRGGSGASDSSEGATPPDADTGGTSSSEEGGDEAAAICSVDALDETQWYRLTNLFLGAERALDTYDFSEDSVRMGFVDGAVRAGQYWKFTPINYGDGEYFRLSSWYLGEDRALDTWAGGGEDVMHMGFTVNDGSGQYWKLTPIGDCRFRLTNLYMGDERALDTYGEEEDSPRMGFTANDGSGQYWKLTPVDIP